jgi:hypothetical protein
MRRKSKKIKRIIWKKREQKTWIKRAGGGEEQRK